MNTTNKTIHIDIEIPEKLFFSLGEDISLFRGNVKLYAAIFLFQSHKLSLGKSAEFAGVSKDYFLDLLKHIEDLEKDNKLSDSESVYGATYLKALAYLRTIPDSVLS